MKAALKHDLFKLCFCQRSTLNDNRTMSTGTVVSDSVSTVFSVSQVDQHDTKV